MMVKELPMIATLIKNEHRPSLPTQLFPCRLHVNKFPIQCSGEWTL